MQWKQQALHWSYHHILSPSNIPRYVQHYIAYFLDNSLKCFFLNFEGK